MKLFTPSAQVPLFWQGLGVQSSMLVSQFVPLNPAAQVQV